MRRAASFQQTSNAIHHQLGCISAIEELFHRNELAELGHQTCLLPDSNRLCRQAHLRQMCDEPLHSLRRLCQPVCRSGDSLWEKADGAIGGAGLA